MVPFFLHALKPFVASPAKVCSTKYKYQRDSVHQNKTHRESHGLTPSFQSPSFSTLLNCIPNWNPQCSRKDRGVIARCLHIIMIQDVQARCIIKHQIKLKRIIRSFLVDIFMTQYLQRSNIANPNPSPSWSSAPTFIRVKRKLSPSQPEEHPSKE